MESDVVADLRDRCHAREQAGQDVSRSCTSGWTDGGDLTAALLVRFCRIKKTPSLVAS